jgi:predicted anti-sigma-YlaC factor YlaD
VTTPECTAARELAPELALGLLDGAERARVLEHVHDCSSCQALVSELSGIADLLAGLAPQVEPPPGFGQRVVAATRWRERRLRRRWIASIAAVAAAAAIGAVALVRIIDADRATPTAAAGAPQLVSAPMRGAGGMRVGRVVSSTGTPATMSVTVDYAVPDGEYALQVRPPGAIPLPAPITTMKIADGEGSWTGRVATIQTGSVVELVAADGSVVCHATVRTTDAN